MNEREPNETGPADSAPASPEEAITEAARDEELARYTDDIRGVGE